MSLATQFKSLLEPELMEGFVDKVLHLKLFRFSPGKAEPTIENLELGPLPRWFTLYEVKLCLWNHEALRLPNGSRNPAFTPALVFLGEPIITEGESTRYKPIDLIWKNMTDTDDYMLLPSPETRMVGPPDDNFVDSAGSQKSVRKTNRLRMTINDVFELDKGRSIPELHVFLYIIGIQLNT